MTLHDSVQRFYAEQMHLLDAGATDEWAATFTDSGVFDGNGLAEPVRGRTAIAVSAGASRRKLDESGVVHRHWLGMVRVQPVGDDTVLASSYALVIATERGGESRIHRSTVCEDVLVRDGDGWLVRERYVTTDHLPTTTAAGAHR